MSRDAVELRIGGRRYGGWKRVSVTHALDALAGEFRVSVSERFPGAPGGREIRMGDAVDVLIGGETVVTGYVDDESVEIGTEKHALTYMGRDRTGDLVDCSAVHEPGEWQGLSAEKIAQELCKPFGIEVVVVADTGEPLRNFKIEEGEPVFSALERISRHRGFLLRSDSKGRLILDKVGSKRVRTRLEEGKNILSASVRGGVRDRYSRYIVKGQQQGNDFNFGQAAAAPSAESGDPGVTRNRPLVVIAEDQLDPSTAQKRADWEASSRAGRARRVRVTVQGFRDGEGSLWQPNTLVQVESASLHVRRELLISQVTRVRGERGTRTELELMRPDAFIPEPLPESEGEDDLWIG